MKSPFDIHRLLEQMTDQIDQTAQWFPDERRSFQPRRRFPIDLTEQAEEFVVTAELPGFEEGDIELRITEKTLWIEASREESEQDETKRHLRRERRSTKAQRSIRLPETIDPDASEAKLHNGVLTVSIPKAHNAEDTRRIDIE